MGVRLDIRTLLAISLTVLFWASAFAGIRVGLQGYDPFSLALLRFLICSLVLGMYAIIKRVKLPKRRDIPHIMITGLFGISIYHVSLNYGEITVPAGTAGLLINAAPIFTALLATLFLGEELKFWNWVGILISFSGVVIITLAQSSSLGLSPGVFLILLAAFSQSFYLILQKPLLTRYTAFEFTLYAVWSGTFFLLIFSPNLFYDIYSAPLSTTLAVIYLGVFPSAIGYFMIAYALSKLSTSIMASYLYLIPIVSILIAWVWLKEILTLLSLVGGTVILFGLLLVNRRDKMTPKG